MSPDGKRLRRRPAPGLVAGLALADLRHEWILTACLAVAIAAVVAPLLILEGLREGTIGTLRDRLVQDPVYREIRPTETKEHDPAWLAALAEDPRVGFLIPTILPASSILSVRGPGQENSELLDLIPTTRGDPLILENGGVIPGPGEAVLTAEAAARLGGVAAGETIQARATRQRGGRTQAGTQPLKVVAVLEARAGTLPRIYAPLQFVLDVEAYKEGRAVPARGWDGDRPVPPPRFDRVLVLLPAPLDAIARTGLAVNTGLATTRVVEADRVAHLIGLRIPADWQAIELSAPNATVGRDSLTAVAGKLRGRGALVLPVVDPMAVTLDGAPMVLRGLSLSPTQANALEVAPTPWGGPAPDARDAARLTRILMPAGSASAPGASVRLDSGPPADLSVPLTVAGQTPDGMDSARVPVGLLGVLRTAGTRPVRYEAGSGFVLGRVGYRGFRLYAASIDDVAGLSERLRADEIAVIARTDDIQRVRILDEGLTRLFRLVAILGVGGGVAVLIASLYAAVERKRRDLAILRLIGLRRGAVFRFPVVQGLALALLGLAVALAAALGLAEVINSRFADALGQGQALCDITPATIGQAVAAVGVLAILSALVAAMKTTRIEPGEAIRAD
jgi:putative ABC transport system permease protein